MLLPQDTSVTILNDRKLKQDIEIAGKLAPFYSVYKSNNFEVLGILGRNPHYKNIRTFSTPILLKEDKIVIDIRTGVRGDSEKPTIDQLPFLQTRYAILIGEWITKGDNRLVNCLDALVKIYSYWLAGIIANQYGLSTDERECVGAVLAAYYLSRRANDVIFDDTLRAMCLRRISNIFYAEFVSPTLSHIPNKFVTRRDLIETIKKVVGHEKLADFDEAMLVKFVSVNVSGIINSDMIFATAIEYPPAFISLVLTILNNNFLQKACSLGRTIANLTTDRDRKTIEREFKFY